MTVADIVNVLNILACVVLMFLIKSRAKPIEREPIIKVTAMYL